MIMSRPNPSLFVDSKCRTVLHLLVLFALLLQALPATMAVAAPQAEHSPAPVETAGEKAGNATVQHDPPAARPEVDRAVMAELATASGPSASEEPEPAAIPRPAASRPASQASSTSILFADDFGRKVTGGWN